jgi:hypothetical protein
VVATIGGIATFAFVYLQVMRKKIKVKRNRPPEALALSK